MTRGSTWATGSKYKRKKKKSSTSFFPTAAEMREGGERSSRFSLRSTEIGWSDLVGPRSKVHLLDEGYAWV